MENKEIIDKFFKSILYDNIKSYKDYRIASETFYEFISDELSKIIIHCNYEDCDNVSDELKNLKEFVELNSRYLRECDIEHDIR